MSYTVLAQEEKENIITRFTKKSVSDEVVRLLHARSAYFSTLLALYKIYLPHVIAPIFSPTFNRCDLAFNSSSKLCLMGGSQPDPPQTPSDHLPWRFLMYHFASLLLHIPYLLLNSSLRDWFLWHKFLVFIHLKVFS